MAMRPRKRQPAITFGEVFVWLLFFALLVPAGLVGWAIGHSESGTKTRTVTVGAAASTSTPSTPSTTPTKTSPPPSANAKALFVSSGCAVCHTFGPAGTHGKIGPDLDTKPEADAKKAHMQLAAFVRESIVKPSAYISPGYTDLMPKNFATKLTKAQLAALVSFISGKK